MQSVATSNKTEDLSTSFLHKAVPSWNCKIHHQLYSWCAMRVKKWSRLRGGSIARRDRMTQCVVDSWWQALKMHQRDGHGRRRMAIARDGRSFCTHLFTTPNWAGVNIPSDIGKPRVKVPSRAVIGTVVVVQRESILLRWFLYTSQNKHEISNTVKHKVDTNGRKDL